MKDFRQKIVINKVARLSIIINAVQILLMLGIVIAISFGDSVVISSYYTKAVLLLAALCEDGTVCLIIMTATSLASALAELMFAAMQRYNRPRLERVAEHMARRAERRMAHEDDGRL